MPRQTAQHAQKKQKRKKRENNVHSVGSTKTMITQNRCAHRRCTTSLQAPRTSAYQAAPSGRNTTTTTLLPGQVLGFPPVRGGAWGRGRSDALQEGRMAPMGVTAKPARISPIRQTPTTPNGPTRTTRQATHERAPPRTCHHHRRLTVVIEARPTRARGSIRERRTAARATTPEETTSTAIGGHRPDAARGAYQALEARPSPKGAREAPVAELQ